MDQAGSHRLVRKRSIIDAALHVETGKHPQLFLALLTYYQGPMARSIFIFQLLVLWFASSAMAQQDSMAQEEINLNTSDSASYDEDIQEESIQNQIPADTLKVTIRKFDEARLEELRKNKDFHYTEAPTVGESLWERFWKWLLGIILEIFRGAVTTNWGRVLLYAGCLVVVVVVVMALLKVDAFKVLFKGAGVSSGGGVFHEDIHTMDFEALIKEAVAKKDFRNAVRLVFLHSLKLLADGQHIRWQPGKTNHDYLAELKEAELKPGLGELSFYFDYAWYGGFFISESQFVRVQHIFNQWRGGIP